jgi:hypothetical protein
MDEWPASWAGTAADEAVGRALVLRLRPFMRCLHEQKLAAKTVRRHLDNLWVIGGEIIRQIGYDPTERVEPANDLLLEAIAGGEAPLVHDFTDGHQASLDSTARKLRHFLSAQDQRRRT